MLELERGGPGQVGSVLGGLASAVLAGFSDGGAWGQVFGRQALLWRQQCGLLPTSICYPTSPTACCCLCLQVVVLRGHSSREPSLSST